MRPSNSNAFLRPTHDRVERRPKSLAGLLSTMRAELKDTDFGYSLEIEPMRAINALRPWKRLADRHDTEAAILWAPAPAGNGDSGTNSLAALARRLDVPVIEQFNEHQLLLDHEALRDILALTDSDGLVAVLVDGPIEPADAEAIDLALRAGETPLKADCRAVAAMRIVKDRAVAIETRTRRQAAVFVADNFRQYLAALRDRPADDFSSPETSLIEDLLLRTGRLAVRPIETEVYSTSIDVGVSTISNGEIRPADGSLIYDITSDTWHGE